MPHARLAAYTAPPAPVVAALDSLRQANGIPRAFSAQALAEAEAAARSWADGGPQRFLDSGQVLPDAGAAVQAPVRDARDLPLATIDPPGSMDLDQALAIEALDGHVRYRVHYAIASPATFVRPGGALDAELQMRGETVYAPDRSTPLHPEVLSHGAASLLPEADRPACLWSIDLDTHGEVLGARVERALVRSRARLSYAQVQAVLDGEGVLSGGAGAPSDLPELLRTVGGLRQAREVVRGGISLATPEQQIETADGGYRLAFRAALPAEEWNAQISLMTGMCAAQIMVDAGVGILRTMPPAAPESYARLRRAAEALGVAWPDNESYPERVRRLDLSQPADVAFAAQAASLFRGAGYMAFGVGGVGVPGEDVDSDTQEAVHAAIAARYAHVTAPLRRLVDRYGLEVCVAACAGAPVPEWVLQALPGLAGLMEAAGRRSRAMERGALGVMEALALAGHEGEVFTGVVTSERDGRGEVMLREPAVTAPVRGAGCPLPVGHEVRVRLVRADVASGRVELEIS